MDKLTGIISFIIYGIFIKFSFKTLFSLIKFNFFSAFIYGLITFTFITWASKEFNLCPVTQIIETVQYINNKYLNIKKNSNNTIKFNIRNISI